MVFIPIVPHPPRKDNSNENLLLLLNKTKKVVVKDMDFVVRGGTISDSDLWIYNKLPDEIESIADGRKVIDYQVMPYRIDGYHVEDFLVLVTCEKCRWD